MSGFQIAVATQPAPAVEGDFSSSNPWSSMLAGEGALTAGPAGVTVGRFAHALLTTGVVTSARPGGASRLGFVGRHQPQIITAFLGQASLLIPGGLETTLHDSGDFWCRFAAGATIGQKAFAADADGTATSAVAGTVTAGQTETVWFVTSTAAAGELAKISVRPVTL
jgi:hypothetical protein